LNFVFALAGTIAGTAEVELRHLNRVHEGWLMRGVMIANLGLLLSLSATLVYAKPEHLANKRNVIIKIIAAVFAASLIFIIDPTAREADYIRFFLLSFGISFAGALLPLQAKGRLMVLAI
jgi:hypothetical protein